MDILKQLEDRKEKLVALEKERTKVEIRLEEEMKRLADMGCATIEEAQAELERRKKVRDEALADAAQLIKDFDEKYKDFI